MTDLEQKVALQDRELKSLRTLITQMGRKIDVLERENNRRKAEIYSHANTISTIAKRR